MPSLSRWGTGGNVVWRSTTRFLGIALLVFGLMALPETIPTAEAARALPVDDKETLFQRVLTKPGAILGQDPSSTGGTPIPPFTVLYVYERRDGRVRVGDRVEGGSLGWLSAERTIDWEQTIVAAFNNPANRERVLLFEDSDSLMRLINSEAVAESARVLRDQAVAGDPPADSGIVSIEPAEYVDITEQLYILPILEAEDVRLPGRNLGKRLRVASIPFHEQEDIDEAARDSALKDLRVEMVFVIDTTVSMDPYIEETRRAVRDFARQVTETELGERISFGLIGFRDSTELAPDAEYVTRTYLDLRPDSDANAFVEAIDGMQVSPASTHGFSEDALAGLHAAVHDIQWSADSIRLVLLVSDASPRIDEHRYIADLRERELRELLDQHQVGMVTWHLKTAMGSFDHEAGEESYRILSRFAGEETYFGIDGGNRSDFGAKVDQTLSRFNQIVEAALDGEVLDADSVDDEEDAAMLRLGRALQMAYLGRAMQTTAPDVFEAWMLDRDIPDFRRGTVDVRVLLTKNQLATLRDVVGAIVEEAEAGMRRMSGADFFDQLRTAISHLARDPNRLVDTEFEVLGDAVGDYLEGLPYQSEFMGIAEQDWVVMSGGEQRRIVDGLRSKLVVYENIHDNPDLWTALTETAPDGEHVAAIPLSAMP